MRLFGGRKKQYTNPVKSTISAQRKQESGLKVPYKPQLTESLKNDHGNLLTLFGELMEAAKNGDHDDMGEFLTRFASQLKTHLREEYLYLYVFLEYSCEQVTEDMKKIRDFRVEMMQITGTVMGTIHKFENTNLNDESVNRFIDDFGKLGEVLVDRIKREEAYLYLMYDKYGGNLLSG